MRVTVGITTYRRLKYLEEAVQSALDQSFDDFEILISQNPHPDTAVMWPIERWCREQAEVHPRVRYRKNTENIGVAGNLNAIAADARGEFLIMIGDDDRLVADGLSRLIRYASDDVDVVFANHAVIDSHGEVRAKLSAENEARFGRTILETGALSQVDAEKASWNVSIALAASLVRTEAFREYGYRPHLTKGDTELFIRMARDGRRFFFCDDRVSEIRHHDDRATASVVGFGDLALELLDADVSPGFESKKREALAVLTRQGVSDKLLFGQLEEARMIMASPYYRRFSIKTVFQVLCAQVLPDKSGVRLFKGAYKLYRRSIGQSIDRELGLETLHGNSNGPSSVSSE